LIVVGAVAGFLVAEPAASRDYETVQTVGDDSNAFAVDLSEEKRMRFLLEAEAAQEPGADEPEARFSVYDPHDAHFASLELAGDGDSATVLADEAGAWVIFVSAAEDGDLSVQVEGSGSEKQVRSLETTEERRTVATGDGGPADANLALRVDQRPAQAYLDVDGSAQSLDASASSEEGPVHEYRDVDSDDGRLANGSQRFQPGNLAAGTYEITAQVEALNGTVDFVTEHYKRPPEPETEARETPEAEQETSEPEEPPTSVVATLSEQEAAEVAPQGADEIVLEVPEDVRGKVFVLNASDALVQQVSIGDREEDSQDRSNGSSVDRATFEFPEAGSYALYVPYLDGHGEYDEEDDADEAQVTVKLPDVQDAEPAENLSIAHEAMEVEGDNETATFNVTGGLVGIGADSRGWSWESGDVTVEGPRGVVLESGGDGSSWHFGSNYETFPERFSDGTFEVTVEDDGGFGFGDDGTRIEYGYLDR
jgi:hypothetical protein